MERTQIGDLKNKTGQSATINGWVTVRRDQGKMVFFDFRDRSGAVQGVVLPKSSALEIAKETTVESAVSVTGLVNARPEKNITAGKQNGDIELVVEEMQILSKSQTLPFELSAEINLDTHLDNLPLTLKTERSRDIFTMQASIVEAFREAMRSKGFTEFMAPALVGGDAEGGAAAFKVEYYNDNAAYLATSPQFYKQIMVGPFERAFTVAKFFRGERSATTRHLSEAVSMDFEMGFIQDHMDVVRMLNYALCHIVKTVSEKHADVFARFNVPLPLAPEKFPVFTLQEALEIIKKEFGRDNVGASDMEPEDERQICEYAKRELGSDFVVITHYPTKKRAFYTYADPENPVLSRGFDFLFRGLEITSGAQRIHEYESLVSRLEEKGLDPKKFAFYLSAFKYGMPPHGGSATGLERITARMLEIPNVKEATSFPRDMTRIDSRLNEDPENVL